jgi:CTP synthase
MIGLNMKHIFITGGVVSGLGKGIVAASLGRLLKSRGLKVAAQKLDPYINIDPGTMNPYEHGEVFVTDDGAETDLDLGHYERFIDESLNKYSNLTSGKVFWTVLNKEREGKYLGETVQIVPHVTNEIKNFIYAEAKASKCDVLITEIGGVVGDIEGQHFLEAVRQIGQEKGSKDVLFIHVTLVPFISGSGEHKSKPTQQSVKELQSFGIRPDIIVVRADTKINESVLSKVALFCGVGKECVIENLTVKSLYQAPLMFRENGLDTVVCKKLGLKGTPSNLKDWEEIVKKVDAFKKTVKIAIVGKYVNLKDAYLSIIESLNHAGIALGVKVEIEWVDSETITQETVKSKLSGCLGILIPGGFGVRGIEGKILACKYARENNIPYFGICLGMQIAVIEFARNVLKIETASSGEFTPKGKTNVIDLMPDQRGVKMGGTMRLGSYPCKIKPNTIMSRAYKAEEIAERHRHRYEFNNDYRDQVEKSGMKISGTSPSGFIVEAVEIPRNKFFIGVQYHPEFKSRPNRPHPLFLEFVDAAKG